MQFDLEESYSFSSSISWSPQTEYVENGGKMLGTGAFFEKLQNILRDLNELLGELEDNYWENSNYILQGKGVSNEDSRGEIEATDFSALLRMMEYILNKVRELYVYVEFQVNNKTYQSKDNFVLIAHQPLSYILETIAETCKNNIAELQNVILLDNDDEKNIQKSERTTFLRKDEEEFKFLEQPAVKRTTKDFYKSNDVKNKPFEALENCIVEPKADYDWKKVAGCEKAKKYLYEGLVLPVVTPHLFKAKVLRSSSSLLLYGPPGTGKTILALSTIGELLKFGINCKCIKVNPSDLLSMWTGETEKSIRALFSLAKKLSIEDNCCIIFIDELDAIATSRQDTQNDSISKRMLTELLIQMSNINNSNENDEAKVIVIAATNRPNEIDPACVRRFSHRVEIPLPDVEAKVKLINILLEDIDHDIDMKGKQLISESTTGFSGSDLNLLIREAAMIPIREINITDSSLAIPRKLSLKDVECARKIVHPLVESMKLFDAEPPKIQQVKES